MHATISQSGANNNGSISQRDTWFSNATILQNGNAGVASIVQAAFTDNSNAVINQGGFSGEARITQVGAGSTATILQNTGANPNGSFARINQGFGGGNSAAITQGGSIWDGVATVDQTGSGNSANIQQGSGNQNGAFQFGDFAHAAVTQSGNSNEANIDQRAGLYAVATITQSGSSNLANVTQFGTGTALAPNVATVNQAGSGNTGTITQGGGAGNNATINQ